MKHYNPKSTHLNELSEKLNALANPNRLFIIALLQKQDLCVGALAKAVGLSQSALSQHLIRLKEAGILEVRQDKQLRFYVLSATLTASYIGSSLIDELLRLT
ncbi:hypothetical protein CQ054_22510 [Ochrobactrum sp. MYb29]|nr:hypothetical protein CQ054_22510 [Ochrobactrum sp. MYb29]